MGPSRCVWEGWTLASEARTCEVGSRLLICTCICTCLGLGVSVLGDGAEGASRQEPPAPSPALKQPPWLQAALSPGPGAGTLSCLSNNILRIACRWSTPASGRGASPWLLFTSNHAPGSKHRCVFQAGTCTVELPSEEVLVPSDSFTITLHRHVSGQEQVSLVDPQYLPRRHVKLDPPSDVQSNVSSDHCVLTWSIDPALEPLASLLSYELAFKRQDAAWERARHKDRIFGVTRLKLEAAELDRGSTYEARLRVQMAAPGDAAEEERYEGEWSEWSRPARFPSPPRRGPRATALGPPDSALVTVSVVLLLTSLAYLLFRLSPRMKVAWYRDVPSPRPFFQPLYSVHSGDFQTWLGAHRAGPQDGVRAPQGALEASVREAVALLTYDPADAWRSTGPEQQEGSGTGLPASVLPAGLAEWTGQPPAYLPQEDWLPASPARPVPPLSKGDSDYCVLECYGGALPPTFAGNAQGSQPGPALACGLSCDRQSLDAQPGGNCESAGHHQRQDVGGWAT